MVQDYTLDHQDIWKGTFCPQFLILCDKIAHGSIRVITWSPKTFCRQVTFPFPRVCLPLFLMKILREIYQLMQLLKKIIQFLKITFSKKRDSPLKSRMPPPGIYESALSSSSP